MQNRQRGLFYCRYACAARLCKRRLCCRKAAYRRFLDVGTVPLPSLATLVVFIAMSVADHNAAVTKTRGYYQPTRYRTNVLKAASNNWVSQESYYRSGRLNHRPAEHLLDLYGATIKPITNNVSQGSPVRR